MYRAPTSSGGASGFLMVLLILWGALYMAGCAETPSDPGFDEVEEVDALELELATDKGLVGALIQDIENTLGSEMTQLASKSIEDAELLFESAQVAFVAGEDPRAVDLGGQARTVLATALTQGRTDRPLDDYLSRTEQLRDRLASGGGAGEFDRPEEIRRSMDRTVDEIRQLRNSGDDVRAAERAIRGNQEADRDRTRRRDVDPETLARFVVAMAQEAVALAQRLLEGEELTERQQHRLETAIRMAQSAQAALGDGDFHQAIVLGHKAVSVALLAVILPEVTEDEVLEIQQIAEAELEAAAGRDLTEFEQMVLERAQRAFALGSEMLRDGILRGVGLLWRAAVAAAVIG